MRLAEKKLLKGRGLIKYGFCISLIVLMIASKSASEERHPEVPRIDAKMAYLYYKTGNVVLVDAMDRPTFLKKRILGSISLPNDGPQDLDKIRSMEIPFSREIIFIVYCE